MRVYHYDHEVGIYLGSSQADESPLEPGVYLVPGHATSTPPPTCKDGQVAVFVDGAWSAQKDLREVVLYSTETGEVAAGPSAGSIPEGLTDQPRPTEHHCWSGSGWELDEAALRAAEIARIKAEIVHLEAGQGRAVREATLTGDRARLQSIEDQIEALRKQLEV